MSDNTHAFPNDEPPEIQVHSHDRYHSVMNRCAALPPLVTAVVHPVDEFIITSVAHAALENLIIPVLVGPVARIMDAAAKARIDITAWKIIGEA